MNGILPARGGDAIKIVLAKRSVRDVQLPGDHLLVRRPGAVRLAGSGSWSLVYAITQGLLPELPELPELPAFEVSFWAAASGPAAARR